MIQPGAMGRPAATGAAMWFPDFDAERHRYFHPVTRKEYPGSNRLLRQAGLVDASYFHEEIKRRGKYVHQIAYLIDRDDLADYDPQLEGYKQSYERLMATGDCEWDHQWSERPLAHADDKYCGTPDRWGRIYGDDAVGEFKCGGYVPWHELQVCSYRRMRKPRRGKRWREFLIYLHKDGRKATVLPCAIPDREQRFIDTLNLFYWRLKHGDRSCFDDKTEGNPLADFGFGDAD
jgi:hypothetical protein